MPQSLAFLPIHVIFSTKNRSPFLTPTIRGELYPYIAGILRNHNCPLIQIGGVEDHVHILFRLSRTMSVAQVLEKTKTSSSKWVKERWQECASFAWQNGYGAFAVSLHDVPKVVSYIQNQEIIIAS